ncbi:Uncharacterised protein [Mycobacteroides abscessus subsp. abscessus]|nr:Uncharacterised protein [Mycobacteroides abscessus subsp. abscessus]
MFSLNIRDRSSRTRRERFGPILGVVPSVTVARIASWSPSIRFISSVRVDIVRETS